MAKKKAGKPIKRATVKKVPLPSKTSRKASAATPIAKASPKPTKVASTKSSAAKRVGSNSNERTPGKASSVKPSTAKAPVTKLPAAQVVASAPEVSLGRPLVTQEERLYMLFHDDYQARQVFEFLRVENIKELEQFSQQQIVHMMSKPLRMTVDRIRQRLAQFKRSLKDDEQFAVDFLKQADNKSSEHR